MKISAIEYHPTSKKGGSEKAFFEVLAGLKNLGHQVTVFYVEEGDYLLAYDKIGIQHIKIPKTEINYSSVSTWVKLYKAAKIINHFKPDVIYVNQLSDTITASICKLLRQVNIICHIRVPKQGNSRLFNLAGKLVDNFICVNHLIKAQYLNYFKEHKLNVVNDGIKISLKAPLPQRKAFTNNATYLGRLSPEKGLLELLEAWLILKEKFQLEIHLDITGPSDSAIEKRYRQEILTFISEKELAYLVNIKSPITNPFEYFQNYDISIFPSIIDESFGRTLPESVLAGTPVFARKVGIVEQILAPEKNTFVYETELELADRIFKYYHSELSYDFSKLQDHIILNYNIDNNVLLIENILKK
ncbi:glycosyltransferase [Pedobacter alpinus]|uniref:Glycosyltransferase n=1 Tax=Pedobacter alpinus TaxID=1590643 RepID=A0ABW5TQ51_9SPHI